MFTHMRMDEPEEAAVRMPVTVAVLLLLVAIWLGVHITHNVTEALRAFTAAPQQSSVPAR